MGYSELLSDILVKITSLEKKNTHTHTLPEATVYYKSFSQMSNFLGKSEELVTRVRKLSTR